MANSFQVVSGRVEVLAKSSIHDTKTVWSELGGTIELDVERMRADGVTEVEASADIDVDMTAFDAGDWLKNRKLKKDLAVAKHPQAKFALGALNQIERGDGDSFNAAATGTLSWRGRSCQIEASGSGTVTEDRVEATATFTLNVTELGVTPPKVLMFKVEDTVEVTVHLSAKPR